MAEDMVVVSGSEGTAKRGAPLGEAVDLQTSEIVARGVFAAGEMRKDGAHPQRTVGIVEATSQFGDVAAVETESVHTRVELDVYGHTVASTV